MATRFTSMCLVGGAILLMAASHAVARGPGRPGGGRPAAGMAGGGRPMGGAGGFAMGARPGGMPGMAAGAMGMGPGGAGAPMMMFGAGNRPGMMNGAQAAGGGQNCGQGSRMMGRTGAGGACGGQGGPQAPGSVTPEQLVTQAMLADQDADGQLSQAEVPPHLHAAMQMFDTDGDSCLNRDELTGAAQQFLRGGQRLAR